MATAGTEDSDLLFQFNTPINNSLPYFYQEGRELLNGNTELHAEDGTSSYISSSTIGNSATSTGGGVTNSIISDNQTHSTSILSHMTTNCRRFHPQKYHSKVSVALDNTKALSQYNNYLNDKFSHKRKLSQDSDLIRLRQKKLEELVDKFWLKDGEIDESMFDSSSDED